MILPHVGYTKYNHRMPTPDLSTALLRISRAEFHRAELWSRSEDHKIKFPFDLKFHHEGSEVSCTVQSIAPFPVELSVIFGEWLYNLRTALESLVYELAVDNTRMNPPPHARALQFPICDDPAEFPKLAKKRLRDLSDWARTGIEHTQPYHIPTGNGGHALWWLDKLAKLDRHRRHHLIEWRVTAIDAQASPEKFIRNDHRVCDREWSFIDTATPLELVAMHRRPGSGPIEDRDLGVRYMVQPDIPSWVDDAVPGFGRKQRLDERMSTIETAVRGIIEQFRDRLDHHDPWPDLEEASTPLEE